MTAALAVASEAALSSISPRHAHERNMRRPAVEDTLICSIAGRSAHGTELWTMSVDTISAANPTESDDPDLDVGTQESLSHI